MSGRCVRLRQGVSLSLNHFLSFQVSSLKPAPNMYKKLLRSIIPCIMLFLIMTLEHIADIQRSNLLRTLLFTCSRRQCLSDVRRADIHWERVCMIYNSKTTGKNYDKQQQIKTSSVFSQPGFNAKWKKSGRKDVSTCSGQILECFLCKSSF